MLILKSHQYSLIPLKGAPYFMLIFVMKSLFHFEVKANVSFIFELAHFKSLQERAKKTEEGKKGESK